MNDQLADCFQQCFNPDHVLRLAKASGWCQRLGKIHPFEMLYSIVVGQASASHPTLNTQAQSMTDPVTRQAVDQRYTPEAVAYFKAAFDFTLATTLAQPLSAPLVQELSTRFRAVRLFDSTSLACAPELATVFPACGGGGAEAGLKLLLSFEYLHSVFTPLALLPGKRSDQGLAALALDTVQDGELSLFDKGFYSSDPLRRLMARGGYCLTPWSRSVSVQVKNARGDLELFSVSAWVHTLTSAFGEQPAVYLGKGAAQVGPLRMIAFRLPEESAGRYRAALREKYRTQGRTPTAEALELAGWLILITNAPPEKLSAKAAGYLYRVRWQIELVFKQLKSVFRLDVLPSGNAARVECEVWARLMAAVFLFTLHRHANVLASSLHGCEISFDKLAKLVRQMGYTLARGCFLGGERLHDALHDLWQKIMKNTRKETQKSRPTTWENLGANFLPEQD